MRRQYWKLPLFILVLGVFSSLEHKAFAAHQSPQLAQVIRGCKYGGFPKYYSRIKTNDGSSLRIRSTPGGSTIIGAVPNNWAVVVLEWSRNGVWARITDHWGSGQPRFANAPGFREGWVSAGYLKDLGRFCDKPTTVSQLVAPELFGEQPVEVQADWLALGDRLAGTTPTP